MELRIPTAPVELSPETAGVRAANKGPLVSWSALQPMGFTWQPWHNKLLKIHGKMVI